MRQIRIDLHIHSCLSPCGDLEMSPARIARAAALRGLEIIALCDHNSALNCPAFSQACLREGVTGIFGLEITTREEVHVLCLFPTVDTALEMGARMYALLLSGPYDAARFGDQVYVTLEEEILGSVEKHLIGAVDLSMEEIGAMTHELGGLFIPAHIDRSVYSVSSQLGFLPPGDYDGVEVSRLPCTLETYGLPILQGSDAHLVEDIGSRFTTIEVAGSTFPDLAAALHAGAVVW